MLSTATATSACILLLSLVVGICYIVRSCYTMNPTCRHRRRRIIISVEGNIGAGKSTFLRLLQGAVETGTVDIGEHAKEWFSVHPVNLVREPVQQWLDCKDAKNGYSILDLFYQDNKRWAYTFQTFVLLTKYQALQEAMRNPGVDILFVERCIHTDKYVFMDTLMRDGVVLPIERDMYDRWYDEFSQHFVVDGYIHLEASPEIAANRIEKRARGAEAGIPFEYLCKLEEAHKRWLNPKNKTNEMSADGKPVLNIIVNGDFEKSLYMRRALFSTVVNWLDSVM